MTRSEILQIAKPILFNTEMVRAIMDGRKTVTRRVVKPQPEGINDIIYTSNGSWYISPDDCEQGETPVKPPYNPGDYLYVRETWGIGNLFYDDEDIPNLCVCYKASEDRIDETCTIFKITDEEYEKYENRMTANMQDWFPSIHIPKEAARIFLRVKDVRVERLQDITEAGAESEGAINTYGFIVSPEDEYAPKPHTAIEGFKSIWDSTIKPKDRDKYGWDANPWVWVIEFERVEVRNEHDK